MPLTPTQLTALETEITTDPVSMGYATPLATGNHNAIHDLLKEDDPSGVTVFDPVTVQDIRLAIASNGGRSSLYNESVDNTSPVQSQALLLEDYLQATGSELIPVDRQVVRNVFASLFNEGVFPQATVDALVSLSERVARREEVVFHQGVNVTVNDVSQALL